MKLTLHIKFICLMILFFIWADKLYGQGCSGSTPHYTIDMTGVSDSVWTVDTVRNGLCCSTSSPDKCIHFTVTLDSKAQGLSVNLTGGTGTTYYDISCSSSTLVGDTICLSGVGPYEITICKPGNNVQTYTIRSIPKPQVAEATVTVNSSCTKEMSVQGLSESSIAWYSVGNNSTYNSYLNCTSGCDTTVVTVPLSGYPTYVDYVVSGYNIKMLCDTNKFYDTIRVYMYNLPSVSVSPDTAYLCPGTTTATITATPTGGLSPYSYLWSDSTTASSISLSAGTYWVRVTDSLGCYYAYDTVTVISASKPAANITGVDSLCQNATQTYSTSTATGKTYQWSCGTGTFSGSTLLDSIVISFTQGGTHTLSLTVTDTVTGCDSTITKQIFVDSLPVANVVGNAPVCEESFGEIYTATYNASYGYSWATLGGTIVSGGNTNTVTLNWLSSGSNNVQVTVSRLPFGCNTTVTYNVLVTPLPATGLINHD